MKTKTAANMRVAPISGHVELLKDRKRKAKQLIRTAALMDEFHVSYDRGMVDACYDDALARNRAQLEQTLSDILSSNKFLVDADVLASFKAAIRACE